MFFAVPPIALEVAQLVNFDNIRFMYQRVSHIGWELIDYSCHQVKPQFVSGTFKATPLAGWTSKERHWDTTNN
jgi:hypothetical protein